MDKNEMKKLCEELISNPPCCRELQEAGKKWLDSIGTAGERNAAEALIAELEADVNRIDDTIAFFSSDFAKEHFGAERAGQMLKDTLAAKENGEEWCPCPACQRGAKMLEHRNLLLDL